MKKILKIAAMSVIFIPLFATAAIKDCNEVDPDQEWKWYAMAGIESLKAKGYVLPDFLKKFPDTRGSKRKITDYQCSIIISSPIMPQVPDGAVIYTFSPTSPSTPLEERPMGSKVMQIELFGGYKNASNPQKCFVVTHSSSNNDTGYFKINENAQYPIPLTSNGCP